MSNAPAPAPLVFLHYTQAELDRNYDQRGWAPNALEVINRYPAQSEAALRAHPREANVPYGTTPDEVLDIFPCGKPGAPTQVFVHGGAWRNFTKDDYSLVAAGYVPHGINLVIINFSKVLQVPLPVMVDQTRRAISWAVKNVARWQGDPARIYLSAHSSGAHQAAMALIKGFAEFGVADDAIRAAQLVSGPYDMEPVLLSARSSYVKLDKQEEHDLSPARHADRIRCPVFIAYAEHDTDEFQRHSREFAAALDRAGRLAGVQRFAGLNHFEIMEALGKPEGELVRAIVARMA